jgi:3-oxoacyl-[acyl-carrier-protein] synthase II
MELSPTKKALLALKQMQSKLEALEQAKHEPIAVVGIGCRFPGANNPEEFWQLLHSGKDAITEIPTEHWDGIKYYDKQPNTPGKICTQYGGFVPHLQEFDASFFRIAPREAASLDPQQRLLLEVSWEALENAAIPADKIQGSQTGVFIGISATDYWHQLLRRKEMEIDAYLTTGNTHSLASGRLSHFFNFTAPSISIDTACSSSLVAVHLAIKSLRDRECNLALAGGVNRLISPLVSINFSQAKMLSPDGRCKTFDADANGFVRSEGCGIVVLKRLQDALADNDRIRAILLGSAVNQDGRTSSITTPNSLSQQAVIKQALVNSKVEAQQVSYVETHGTGTSLGDLIEVEALSSVFADNQQLILGAVKTNIGHLESASGIASLIKAVLALEKQSITGNLHLKKPNTAIEWQNLPFKLPQKAIAWQSSEQPRIAGVSAFGFSGTNAHVVIQEFKIRRGVCACVCEAVEDLAAEGIRLFAPNTISNPKSHLLTLSARSKQALQDLVQKYQNFLSANPEVNLADLCFTANTGRSHFNYRLAVTATSIEQLQTKLTQFLSQQTPLELWQGKINSNHEPKLALVISDEVSNDLKLAKSLITNTLFSVEQAEICWSIGNQLTTDNNEGLNIIFSPIKSESETWQLLIPGLAQLYVLGVTINWDALYQNTTWQKITLPTYPFQRQTYWVE